MNKLSCAVCGGEARNFVKNFKERSFYQCTDCHFIFELEGDKKISSEDEEKHFRDQWKESPEGGYPQSYDLALWLMATCGKKKINSLDFGCGDGGLVRHLRKSGVTAIGVDRVPVENDMKDFTFKSLEELPIRKFDAISLVEVVEHLHDPLKTLEELSAMLVDDGFIYITTALTNRSLTTLRVFPYWIYQEDATHVSFYHERSFEKIARRMGMDLKIMSDDRIVLDKRFDRVISPHDGKLMFADEKDHRPAWPPWL